jgi:proteic killer suppression protein
VIKKFRHKGSERFFVDGSKIGIKTEHAARLRIVLTSLDSAQNLKDLNAPGLRLHPLKGKREGFWAISVSGNWRIIFRFEGKDIIDVDYLDYH